MWLAAVAAAARTLPPAHRTGGEARGEGRGGRTKEGRREEKRGEEVQQIFPHGPARSRTSSSLYTARPSDCRARQAVTGRLSIQPISRPRPYILGSNESSKAVFVKVASVGRQVRQSVAELCQTGPAVLLRMSTPTTPRWEYAILAKDRRRASCQEPHQGPQRF